jgi:HD-GYP domain-containing protein (c-di-GMP phosphodiesterase class II)
MSSTGESNRFQTVPVASFRLGYQLPFDIFDEQEVLLLRKGSVVSPKFLANMSDRGLTDVKIQRADLKKLMPAALEPRVAGKVDLETAATRDLDAAPFEDKVAEGRALIESIKPRQAVAYDNQMVNQMVASCEQDVAELSNQLTELVEGSNDMPGRSIEKMTTTYIWHMCQDLDATLAVSQVPNKDNYLANHSLQLSIMGMALATQMELPEEEVRVAGIAALLHDLGMAKTPQAIINSPRRLDAAEFLEVMKHPIYTLDMIERVLGIPNRSRLIVYQVHERANGSGYPRKRTAVKTYNIAKCLGIVDAYLAMITDRPYRAAMLPYHAMEQILREAQRGLWEPKTMRAFVSMVGMFPIGSFVQLSDGSLAKVVRSGGANFGKPQINITHNSDGIPQKSDVVVDLAQESSGLSIVQAIPPLFDLEES